MQYFQLWLDRVAGTFFDGDFDTYADTMSLPFTLITTRRTIILQDTDELREGFDAFRGFLRGMRATDLFRLGQDVYPIGGTILCGSYDTHVLRDGQRLIEAYRSSAVLRLGDDGTWRATCIANAMTNRSWPIHTPRPEANDAPLTAAAPEPDWLALARRQMANAPTPPDVPAPLSGGGLIPEP